jgi:hypothetical protein
MDTKGNYRMTPSDYNLKLISIKIDMIVERLNKMDFAKQARGGG